MEKQEIILTIESFEGEIILTNSKGDTFTIPDKSKYEDLRDFLTVGCKTY